MKRRLGLAIRGERSLVGLPPGDGLLEINAVEDKGLGGRAEDLVDRHNEPGFGSPVLAQGEAAGRFLRRLQVSENVRAAKRVDRLLRIADEEQECFAA